MKNILQNFRQDAYFYHQLCFPGRKPTHLSWIRILFGSRGFLVIVVHRISNAYLRFHATGPASWLLKQVIRIFVRFGTYLSKVIAKSSILESTDFEPGVYLSDYGHIILGARSVGTGTIIHDHVTIGMNLIDRGKPEIGRNVWIGDHSIISGNIKINDGVTVLPRTVLTKSLPSGAVVQGNPARIVRRDFDNTPLRHSLSKDVGTLLNEKNMGHQR